MAHTMQDLLRLRDEITQKCGIDTATASRVIGVYNGKGGRPEIIARMIGGDLSPVADALLVLGVSPTERPEKAVNRSNTKTPTPSAEPKAKREDGAKRRKKKIDQERDQERAESVEGEVITDDELPPDLLGTIKDLVLDYCRQYDIENPQKMDARQWRSCCLFIGEYIKKSGVLRDREREAHEGGRIYNGEKVAALLALYDFICGSYRQIAFEFNFPRFAGISYAYYKDYQERGLTSSSTEIRKKAQEIQKNSVVAAIASGGSQTVGNIFLGKALEGMQESTRVEHISISASPSVPELPVFDPSGGLLEEIPNEDGGKSS